jgi:hypothetical protein
MPKSAKIFNRFLENDKKYYKGDYCTYHNKRDI